MFEHTADQPALLQSESPLTTEYTPPEPVNRTGELDQIIAAVRPLARRRQPENLLLYGAAGTGKTLLVDHVQAKLAEETQVTTVSINCWQYNTRSALLTELLIQLGYPAPRKGKPIDALLARLREWVDNHRGILVALDEFDQLTDQAAIAYDLHEISQVADHPLGVLLVSNQPPTALDFEPRSQSRLAYRSLEFRPYSKRDLIAILHQRVAQAFQPNAVADEAIERVAASVAERSGDCREALTLLLRAARVAEYEKTDTVTDRHIDQIGP